MQNNDPSSRVAPAERTLYSTLNKALLSLITEFSDFKFNIVKVIRELSARYVNVGVISSFREEKMKKKLQNKSAKSRKKKNKKQ